MDIKQWISSYHGMELQPVAEDDRRHNENGILFLTEYLFFKDINGELTHGDKFLHALIVDKLRTYSEVGRFEGLFDRGAGESLNQDKDSIRTISHDNITAISCFNYLFADNKDRCEKIRKHGVSNFWRFDNAYPSNPRWSRIMHPRDIVFWSYLGGSFISKFFIWYPILECMYSCFKKNEYTISRTQQLWKLLTTLKWEKREFKYIHTSGKCLSFIRLYALKDKFIGKIGWKVCSFLVKRSFEDGWRGVFNYYFKNQDHPINITINNIYDKNKDIM